MRVSPHFSLEWFSVEPHSGALFPGSSIELKVEIKMSFILDGIECVEVMVFVKYTKFSFSVVGVHSFRHYCGDSSKGRGRQLLLVDGIHRRSKARQST